MSKANTPKFQRNELVTVELADGTPAYAIVLGYMQSGDVAVQLMDTKMTPLVFKEHKVKPRSEG